MSWSLAGPLLPDGGPHTDLDKGGAFAPTVLEEPDGTLRMWYAGHDGSTCRILEAERPPGRGWARLGVSVEPGLAGVSDGYGVESPSVVATAEGYLMAYAGSDGGSTQIHTATSPDGHTWTSQGPMMERGEDDAVGATHPCLFVTGEQWWLFYSGYDGTYNGRHSSILAAVSLSGTTWDRVGAILTPRPGELSVREPWVIWAQRRFTMFYVAGDLERPIIRTATSEDGLAWHEQGNTFRGSGEDGDGLHERSPCVLRLTNGEWRLWFAARAAADVDASYRLSSADFTRGDLWAVD